MKQEDTTNTPPPSTKLAFFPVTLFASVMGYLGFTLVFQKASSLLGVWDFYYQTLSLITIALFTVIGSAYLFKIIKHKASIKQEFNHPIASNFFSAISISFMLMSVLLRPEGVETAALLWYIGAGLQILLTITILNQWIHQDKWQIQQITPTWFIPMVGNIIAPLGAVSFATIEVAWFFFSIGLIFWLILQTIILYRLFFYPAPPEVQSPFLFIFIAPPAVGFLAYMAINENQLDYFARILFYTGLFFSLLLISRAKYFLKQPFSLTWWAMTFPLAAMTNASLVMFEVLQIKAFGFLAALLLAITSGLVLYITLQTLKLAAAGKICMPPPMKPDLTPLPQNNQDNQDKS